MKHFLAILFSICSFALFSQKKVTKQYEKIEQYKDGLSWVYNAGNIGMINEQGIEVIPCEYEHIDFYKEDLYWVNEAGNKGLYSLTKRKAVIKPSYEKIEPLEDSRFKVFYAGTEQIVSISKK